MTIAIRQFQIEGVAELIRRKRTILADDPGLGKTAQALLAMKEMGNSSEHRGGMNVLILCTGSGWDAWTRIEMQKFLPEEQWPEGLARPSLVSGQASVRMKQWANTFTIALQGTLRADLGRLDQIMDLIRKASSRRKTDPVWDLVIVDEAHKCMRNRKTKIYEALLQVAKNCTYLWPLTGSPANRAAQNYWGYLHLLDPKKFSSYWAWVNKFCLVDNNGFGREIVGNRDVDGCVRALEPYMLRRERSQVAADLGEKQRIPVMLQLPAPLRKLYDGLQEDLFAEFDGSSVMAPAKLAAIVQLRKMLVSPRMLFPGYTSMAPALERFLEHLRDCTELERHCVVYTPFREGADIIEQSILEHWVGAHPRILQFRGGLEKGTIGEMQEAFDADSGAIAICTIKFAESYSLASAFAGHFIGYEWDPEEIKQAEDRIVRLSGRKTPALYYYYLVENTIDEVMREVLNTKNMNVTAINAKLGELVARRKQLSRN